MLITGVLCLCAAVLSAGFGTWSLTQSRTSGDLARTAMRAMGPAQLAASVMLAASGLVALTLSQQGALVLVIVGIVGAVGTLIAGSWQSAHYALRVEAARAETAADAGGCAGICGSCSDSCH